MAQAPPSIKAGDWVRCTDPNISKESLHDAEQVVVVQTFSAPKERVCGSVNFVAVQGNSIYFIFANLWPKFDFNCEFSVKVSDFFANS